MYICIVLALLHQEPVLYWVEMMTVDTLILFLILEGNYLVFHQRYTVSGCVGVWVCLFNQK